MESLAFNPLASMGLVSIFFFLYLILEGYTTKKAVLTVLKYYLILFVVLFVIFIPKS